MTEPSHLPNFDNWKPVDPLKLKDAAILWSGEDPAAPETCTTRYVPTFTAMIAAIERGELKAHIDGFEFDEEEREPAWENALVFRSELARWAGHFGVKPAFLDRAFADVDRQAPRDDERPVPTIPNRRRGKGGWLTAEETADLLKVQPQTLAVWRTKQRYPELKHTKIGRQVRYKESSVLEFLESGTARKTSSRDLPE